LKTWIIFYLIPRQWQQNDRKKGGTVLWVFWKTCPKPHV
jgi:hypothetical protein